MKQKRVIIIASVLLLLILTTTAVLAAQTPEGTVVASGETVNNEIVLFGENLEIQAGATVEGDVVLFGGNAAVAGTVTGDIVLFGSNLTAENTAVITGECVLFGGSLDDMTETGITCDTVPINATITAAFAGIAPDMEKDPQENPEHLPPTDRSFFGRLAGTVGQTLMMTLLAFGVATVLPNHLSQVEYAVQRKPMASGIVGLLTAVAVPALIIVLTFFSALLLIVCIGILGFPIVFALAVALAYGMTLGWVTMGSLTGRWLADKLNMADRRLPVTAALGTAVLTFSIGLIGALPFMTGEWLLNVIIGSIGLGAAMLTRFGTRPYPLSAGWKKVVENSITEDPDKITAVLETLPVDDPAGLKNS